VTTRGSSVDQRRDRPVGSTVKEAAQRLLASLPRSVEAARAVALCYHSVAPEATRASTAGSLFDAHLGWLARHCDVVPFLELVGSSVKAEGEGRPRVAITFDDGYEDNYREAFPALVRYGLPATFFITTGLVDRDEGTIARLQRAWGSHGGALRPLVVGQLLEMQAAGMAFGAHTRTHRNLRGLDERGLRSEIAGSRERLEDLLQREIPTFAYPFGDARFHLSATTVAVVASCGFSMAGTVEFRGVTAETDPFLVPRLPVANDPVELLRAKVLGRLDVLGAWRERVPGWLTRRLSSGRRRGEER
jgi:peptidoglycan/xylan/chitin deacetylase (PgdA/CDA1 family)